MRKLLKLMGERLSAGEDLVLGEVGLQAVVGLAVEVFLPRRLGAERSIGFKGELYEVDLCDLEKFFFGLKQCRKFVWGFLLDRERL